ncbi:major facilitator superfamily domain-containing protein [Ditylenchus destructor]|uniref:Major facilitator superfamily domain-containing protein n=1 Tax=Ditylenchus destructor TaxID=166010 RepID=A0AAD4NG82_9BILA|nr:major facilitator superfamily domain-containing protein [Ditylenchus destructor]
MADENDGNLFTPERSQRQGEAERVVLTHREMPPPMVVDYEDLQPDEDWPDRRRTDIGARSSRMPAQTKNILFLAVLIALNLINYMDRFTVASILIDIQTYYKIQDSDGGLIVTTFVFCYMIAAPIFGYLGDRYNRKFVVSIGLVLWILAVFLSSVSGSFRVFLISRAIVGVGEAAYSTVAPTIISDLFSGDQRSRVLMLFFAALPVGSGLGYIVGASVTYWTGYWQWGLRVTPIIGIIFLIIIVFAFEDPVRGHADHAHLRKTSYKEDVLSLGRIPTYIYTTLGFTSVVFVTGSLSWWTPACAAHAWGMIHGMDKVPPEIKASVAETFGVLSCIGGLIGVVFGSLLARKWQKGLGPITANPRADPLVCGFGSLFAVPTMWLALFTVGKWMPLGYLFVFLTIIMVVLNFAITTDIILYVTTPNRRATAIAIQTLTAHLLGDATSPYVIGLLSDAIRGNVETSAASFQALQYALYLPNAVLVLGGVFYFLASNHVEKDREKNSMLMHDLNPPTILDYYDDDMGAGNRSMGSGTTATTSAPASGVTPPAFVVP